MKPNRIILVLLMLFSGLIGLQKVYGQEGADVSEYNVIKWNPFSLARATVTLAYERVLNNHISLVGTFNFTGISLTAKNNSGITGQESISGFGFVPELRYYATYKKNSAPKGFFVGPFLRYQAGSLKGQDSIGNKVELDATRFTVGGDLGYQLIFGHAISLEIFGGPSYENISVTKNANSTNITTLGISSAGYSGIGFRFGITGGVVF